MPQLELALSTLTEFDMGTADAQLSLHLKRAVEDCMQRPGDLTPRKVTMTIAVRPAADQHADCDYVETDISMGCKLPTHRTRTVMCKPRKNGALIFDVDSPENPDQLSFRDLENTPEPQGASEHVDDGC